MVCRNVDVNISVANVDVNCLDLQNSSDELAELQLEYIETVNR